MNAMHSWVAGRPVFFEGKKKDNFSAQELLLERKLLDAGINARKLADEWGVTLWTIRAKDDEVRLKLDVRKKANPDLAQLKALFEKILGRPVKLKLKSVDECCSSPCKGCMAWKDSKRRKDWVG